MLWLFAGGLLLLNLELMNLHVGGVLVQILPLLAVIIAVSKVVSRVKQSRADVHDVLLKTRERRSHGRSG